MIHDKKHITILCSGITLGVYTPAVIFERQLQLKGCKTTIEVFENLFSTEKREEIKELKSACHKSFGFAKMAQRMAKDNNVKNAETASVDELLKSWFKESRSVFLVFSGFWMPIIKKYQTLYQMKDLDVYILHMDAVLSSSWKPYSEHLENYKHIWLFKWPDNEIPCYLQVGDQYPLNFNDRESRLIIHGGGWGIGTYKSKIQKLNEIGLEMDILAYEDEDIVDNDRNDYYIIDPEWCPWEKNELGVYNFPPLAKYQEEGNLLLSEISNQYPAVYNLIRNKKAIISKPGGGTLVDSFSSATPLIMLEPFGDYEEKNASLWSNLGIGIYYESWVNSNYSFQLLEELHSRILELRNQKKNVLETYFTQ